MYGLRQVAAVLLASRAMAQTLTVAPQNGTLQVQTQIGLYVNDKPDSPMSNTPLAIVINLSQPAGDLSPPGISGTLATANPDTQMNLTQNDVALISCDPEDYPGLIKPIDVYSTAETKNVTAVVFYSQHSDRCVLSGGGDPYNMTYSMKSTNDTSNLMARIRDVKDKQVFAVIRPANNGTNGGQNSAPPPANSNGGQQQGPVWDSPGGPTPSTAVAMIILYSITGVITAMFLAIIITGAIRAHRHPERYGPRNIIGRPRQSRARGLAKAMLETLPVVKFGDKDATPKPSEVELENGARMTEATRDVNATPAVTASGAAGERSESSATTETNGISAASGESAPTTTDGTPAGPENQGCSICTDDFEIGQDQRVLPCNHRFHPACVDPWLLNVSGTCPLCRIDLRGESAEAEAEAEAESTGENGSAPPLSPPMTNDRNSTRRSLMLSMMGLHRPDRMTREERIHALRQYRARQEADPATEVDNAVLGQQEQSAMRRTLRRVLRRGSHAPPITTNNATPPSTTTASGSNDTPSSQS